MSLQWVVVVPVKALAVAKSRLADVAGPSRRALAGAFAADTVAALAPAPDVRRVAVVCGDADLARTLAGPGVELVPEPGPTGLNEAAKLGLRWARTHHPDAGVVVVPADLPALRGADVARMLGLAARHSRAALADREGTGTTMLAAAPGVDLRPRFGPASFARHVGDGAVALDATGLARAVRDVDTGAHLRQACRLGVGPATGRVLGGR